MISKEKLTIVIRANGERTQQLCQQIVLQQGGQSGVYLIQEKPFYHAVKKTFEIGASEPSKFLLAIDADVLLYCDALSYILSLGEAKMNSDMFRIDFFIWDKFRGRNTSGVHLYNNCYSRDILEFLNQNHQFEAALRPEYESIKAFSEEKRLSYRLLADEIVGLHDYFQFYTHLFSKYRLRRERCQFDQNLDQTIDFLNEKMARNIDDPDYWMIKDILMGSSESISTLFKKYGLREKENLKEDQIGQIKNLLFEMKFKQNLVSTS